MIDLQPLPGHHPIVKSCEVDSLKITHNINENV